MRPVSNFLIMQLSNSREKAKEFSKVYLYPDNTLDYAECEAGTIMSVMNLLL